MIRVLREVWPDAAVTPLRGWSETASEGIEAVLRGVGVLCGEAEAFPGNDAGGGDTWCVVEQ